MWWARPLKTLLLLTLLFLALDFNYPVGLPRGGEFDRGENAAWVASRWSDTLITSPERRKLANDLAGRGVKWIYAGQGSLDAGGRLPAANSLYAGGLAADVHRAQPDMRILAWISGRNGGSNGLPLADPAVRSRIVEAGRFMVDQLGFDGVHLDIEPAPSGDPHYLTLLDEMRLGIGSHTLSVAAMKAAPFSVNIGPFNPLPYSWDGSYYTEVARRVDQLAVMTYDSALPFANLYIKYVAWQTQRAMYSADEYPECEVFIGVPSYEEPRWNHYPRAENMAAGLQGVLEGLREMRRNGDLPSNFRGIAIFAEWTTSPEEWRVFDDLWSSPP